MLLAVRERELSPEIALAMLLRWTRLRSPLAASAGAQVTDAQRAANVEYEAEIIAEAFWHRVRCQMYVPPVIV